MHYLIFLLLLIASPVSAQWQEAKMNPYIAGAGGITCTSITVDLWQGLDASDFLTSPPSGWSVTDTGSDLSMSTTGEQALISCPGGTADTGTRGLAASLEGVAAFITYTFSSKNNLSIGFWYKVPNTTQVIKIATLSGNPHIQQDFDSGNFRIKAQSSTGTSYCNVSINTWYWLTLKEVSFGTNSFAVYNADGSVKCASGDFTDSGTGGKTTFNLGNIDAANDSGVILYIDDPVIDWTDSTYPLGP